MKRYSRNILVYAENNGQQPGINIYLEFSGQREYLFTHRHNGIMFKMLKDKKRLDDLQRAIHNNSIQIPCSYQLSSNSKEQIMNSIRYMMVVIDDYIVDREQCA